MYYHRLAGRRSRDHREGDITAIEMYTSHAVGCCNVVAHRRQSSLVKMREHLPSPLITTDGRIERGVRVTAQHREIDCRSLRRVVVNKCDETVSQARSTRGIAPPRDVGQ